ncbi:MAG: FkbM family methyltransferase [Deltaproteobacteria bacterium]|nr:FkbM family methyltransferase [Deltaproteobacteria bacterium]
MTLKELSLAYKAGSLSKPEYIDRMHAVHAVWFDYAELLKATDIAAIEITGDAVTMTTRRRGLKLAVDPYDARLIPIEILNFGSYETEELRLVEALITDNSVILDIGANIGWYSLNLSLGRPKITIHAFEPIPGTYAYLTKNLKANGITRVTPHNFGFSNKNAVETFYFYPAGSGNASAANLTGRDDVMEIKCRVQRLDDFVQAENLTVDFIKCDVEGAELFVFEGGLQTLTTQKPVVFTEMLRKWSAGFGYHPNQLIELFKKIGYGCYIIRHDRLAPFESMDEHTQETNFIFLHPDQHRDKIRQLVRN